MTDRHSGPTGEATWMEKVAAVLVVITWTGMALATVALQIAGKLPS
jgi:hypothetical protein